MSEPKHIVETDDEMSMTSELEVTVNRSLGRINLKHSRQNGSVELIQLYPVDVDELCEFLQKAKTWIDSGFKEKLKPQ